MVSEYVALGLERSEAIFLALTSVEVYKVDERTALVVESFPTGNTAELTISVTPTTGDPDELPTIVFVPGSDDLRFRLEYFLAASSIPADVLETMPSGRLDPPIAGLHGARAWGPLAAPVGTSDGYEVAVDAVVSRFAQDRVNDFIKYLEGEDRDYSRAKLYKNLKAAMSPADALKLRSEFDNIDAELDALRRCVENPTNPIAIERYQSDPGYRQELLERIESTRSEIKGNTLVLFLGLIAKVGGGLAQGVSWLGYITGTGTAVAKDRLKSANAELLEQLRREIVGCDAEWQLSMTASRESVGIVIAWTGTFGKAPPPPGHEGPETTVTGAGRVDATWTFDTCTTPTDLSGNSETRTGTFVVHTTGDLAISGSASLDTTIFPPKEKFELLMSPIEESIEQTAPAEGCLEAAFVAGFLAAMAFYPDQVWGPLGIHAEDGILVRGHMLPEFLDDEMMIQLGDIERVATLRKIEGGD